MYIDCVALAKQGNYRIGHVRPFVCLCVRSPVWTVWHLTLAFNPIIVGQTHWTNNVTPSVNTGGDEENSLGTFMCWDLYMFSWRHSVEMIISVFLRIWHGRLALYTYEKAPPCFIIDQGKIKRINEDAVRTFSFLYLQFRIRIPMR